MTGPKYAEDRDGKRFYAVHPPVIPETVEKPSVTTILDNGMPSHGIGFWKEYVVREVAVENRADLATMTEDAARTFLKGHPDRIMRAAGDKGTDIHAIVEKIMRGEDIGGFADMYPVQVEAVRDWIAAFNVQSVRTEATVVHPGEHGYVGTADGFADIDGVRTCWDLKTGKNIYMKHALQCAAYAKAKWILTDDRLSHTLTADLGVEQVGVLHLTDTGYKWHVSPHSIDHLFEKFCAVHTVAMWELEDGKGALGKPVDPNARTEYATEVRDRLAQVIEWGGADDLAANWPAGIPTFRDTDRHTIAQLDAIEYVVRRMEPRHRPKPPVASPERHDELAGQLADHPDLDTIQKYAVAAGVTNLRGYANTVDQLDTLERIVTIVGKVPDPEDRAARLWRASKGRTTNPAEATDDDVAAFLRTRATRSPVPTT